MWNSAAADTIMSIDGYRRSGILNWLLWTLLAWCAVSLLAAIVFGLWLKWLRDNQ